MNYKLIFLIIFAVFLAACAKEAPIVEVPTQVQEPEPPLIEVISLIEPLQEDKPAEITCGTGGFKFDGCMKRDSTDLTITLTNIGKFDSTAYWLNFQSKAGFSYWQRILAPMKIGETTIIDMDIADELERVGEIRRVVIFPEVRENGKNVICNNLGYLSFIPDVHCTLEGGTRDLVTEVR